VDSRISAHAITGIKYEAVARAKGGAVYGIRFKAAGRSERVGIVSGMDADLSAARRQEMLEIARATGGTAKFNNNISQALRDDFNQANAYYTVAYPPPDKEWQGAYHRVQISVDKPEAQLVYREGYYARSAEAEAKPTPEQFRDALRMGDDIRVELVVLNWPANLPVPLAERNPPIDFVVEQQQKQQKRRGSATSVHTTPQCQYLAVFNTHAVSRLVQCQSNWHP
jgi:hypothetical protein